MASHVTSGASSDSARGRGPPAAADGVWLLGGATHNSVAVEFQKFVAVIEAPLDEQRSLAVIEEVVKLVPNKPIRFVVNTHNHYDHLGGLRTYTDDDSLEQPSALKYVPTTTTPNAEA